MKAIRTSLGSVALTGVLLLSACPETKHAETMSAPAPKPATPPAASQPAATPPAETPPAGAPGAGAPAAGTPPAATPPPATTGAPSAPSGALDKGTTPETRDQMDPDGVIRRGLALSGTKPLTVTECIGGIAKLTGSPVKVTGKVESVCQNKGCWFILQGDKPDETIRITAKGYGFFVPSSVVGKIATVEGDLKVTTLSSEEAEHLEKERTASAHAAAPREGMREIAITAVGLELNGRG